MAFFLIGRGPDNELQLLSNSLFATRQDAMAELSQLSAEAGFEHWDTDVFVADLDQSAPVLLVRPAAPAAFEPAAAVEPEEPAAEAWVADLTDAPVLAEAYEIPAAQIADTFHPDSFVADVEREPAHDLEEAVTIVFEPEQPPAPPAPTYTQAERDELRDALLRTTESMTAEGLEPPASAGLSEPQAEPAVEPLAESLAAAWPWDALNAELVASAPETVDAAEVYEALETPVAAEPACGDYPMSESSFLDDLTIEPIVAPQDPMSVLAEPQAAQPEPAHEPEPAPAAEFEPAPAPEAAPAEEPTQEPALTPESDFILDLDSLQPVAPAETAATVEEGTPTLDESPDFEPYGSAETGAAEPSAEPELEADTFSTQWDETPFEPQQVETAPEPEADTYKPAGYTLGDAEAFAEAADSGVRPDAGSMLTDYTCEDCVYVATCPNRDQRLPKDCGSFQWR